MALRPSVRSSVASHSYINTAERMELAFGTHAALHLSYIEPEDNRLMSIISMVFSSGTLSQTLDLGHFATARRPSQVLSTQVDAQCDKLATLFGHQFISPTVHICVPGTVGVKHRVGRVCQRAAKTCSYKISTGGRASCCLSQVLTFSLSKLVLKRKLLRILKNKCVISVTQ